MIRGGKEKNYMYKRSSTKMTNEEYRVSSPDYGELIIEMVYKIGKTDNKFLCQIYTIMHRHIKKEG